MNSLGGSLAWRKAWRAPPFFKKKKKSITLTPETEQVELTPGREAFPCAGAELERPEAGFGLGQRGAEEGRSTATAPLVSIPSHSASLTQACRSNWAYKLEPLSFWTIWAIMRARSDSSCNISPVLARQAAGAGHYRGENRLRTGSQSGPVTLLGDLITQGLLQRALPSNCRAVCPFLSGPPHAWRFQPLRSAGRKRPAGWGEGSSFSLHCSCLVCCWKARGGALSSRATAPLMHQGKSESCVFCVLL